MERIPQINKCDIRLVKKNKNEIEWRAIFKIDGADNYLTLPIMIKEMTWSSGELQFRNKSGNWKKLDKTTHINFKDHLMVQIIFAIRKHSKFKQPLREIKKIKFSTPGYKKEDYDLFPVNIKEEK